MHQLGLPIRPAFWKDPRPRDELRAELGLEADAPVAMVMGGGDGVGGMGAIAAAVINTLGKELDRSQVRDFFRIGGCGSVLEGLRRFGTSGWREERNRFIFCYFPCFY